MRKLLVLLFLILAGSSCAFALVSIRPYAGLGLPFGSYVVGTDKTIIDFGDETKKNLYYSLGEGLKYGCTVELNFFKNLSIGAGVGFSSGTEKEVDKSENLKDNSVALGYPDTKSILMKATTSYMSVDIILKARTDLWILSPYIGVGPAIILNPKSISTKQTIYFDNTTENYEDETTYEGTVGLQGILGVDVKLMKLLNLFVEAKFESIALKTSKMKVTKYAVNGQDKLSTLTTSEKETEYNEYGGSNTDPNVPTKENASVYPANNVTLAVGIAINF